MAAKPSGPKKPLLKRVTTFGALICSLSTVMPVSAASVGLQQATATFSQSPQELYGVNQAIDGVNNLSRGWAINPNEGISQTAVFETVVDAGFAGGSIFTFILTQSFPVATHTLGHFRISVTTDNRNAFADGLLSGGNVAANWTVLDPMTALSANGATLSKLGDYSILASGISPSVDTYTVTAVSSLAGITGFRLEALTDPSLPFGGPGRYTANGNFVLNEFAVDVTAVPEVQTYALMLAGLGLVAFVTTRRKH